MNIVQLNMFDGKVCKSCGLWKVFDLFDRHPRTTDRRVAKCKQCRKVERALCASENYEKTKQWRIKNPDRFRLYHRKQSREYATRRRALRPKKTRVVLSQEQRIANRRYHSHRWSKQNPDRRRAIAQAYRARRVQAIGTITTKEWHALCERYGNRCLGCGQEGPVAMDHIIPLSRGGTHVIDNVQPLCLVCNSRKGTTTIDYRPLYD